MSAQRVLDRYDLLEALETDSVGTVYLARPIEPVDGARFVIVTRIHEEVAEDPRCESGVLDARLAMRLEHPNVVRLLEVEKGERTYFLVSEYVHGATFAYLRARAAELELSLPLSLAASLVARAADGLHAGHDLASMDGKPLGIVHRDVRPRTLYATFEGGALVSSFGTARFHMVPSTLTSATERLPYVSPEQANAEGFDRRADIFSLGVVLWELATLRPLFVADSAIEMVKLLASCDIPRPSTVRADISPAFEDVVMTAVAKDPSARFASAAAFADALRACAPAASESNDTSLLRATLEPRERELASLLEKHS